jgi:thiamine phosphate synthase YjbQ (UPF0047 family)
MIEFSVSTPPRETLVDITERVRAALPSLGEDFTGMVNVFVPHTTAGVTINERLRGTFILIHAAIRRYS